MGLDQGLRTPSNVGIRQTTLFNLQENQKFNRIPEF